MKALLLSLCLVLCGALPAYAKHHLVPLQTAKVISQNIGTYRNGAVAMPIGGMLAAIPIRRMSDVVVVETATTRMTWVEAGRKFVVLPVNGTIRFYQDGKWFIVPDLSGKKHKFALVHLEAIPLSK